MSPQIRILTFRIAMVLFALPFGALADVLLIFAKGISAVGDAVVKLLMWSFFEQTEIVELPEAPEGTDIDGN